MSKCWAASLENCAEGISREHYISEAFFSAPAVSVKGLAWCKDEPKTVGINAATAKILCRKHNSDLSPLDQAAGQLMSVIREHLRLSDARPKKPASPLKIERLAINARLLERWLLKCTINLLADGPYLIGTTGQEPGQPPHDLVRVVYGLEPFVGQSGMYIGGHVGQDLQMGEVLQFSPLVIDDQRVTAGLFRVAGLLMYLSLDSRGITASLSSVTGLETDWRATTLKRPFKKIVVKHGKYISHTIEFQWPNSAQQTL